MAGMPTRLRALAGLLLLLPLCCVSADKPAPAPAARDANAVYETRPATPNGIGKFYLGREIAQVMGHQAAGWLERPERDREEQPALLMKALKLKPGDVVADVGAGSGYFTLRIAQEVGPRGKVYAVDIQKEMLDIIRRRARAARLANVEPVL